jgi:hypothetical protein
VFGIPSDVPSRSWGDDQLRDAAATSHNLFQVCLALRISPGARTYALLRRHIARVGIDRLENLRILCPNCHALTDTWCARNRKPA